MRSTAATRAVPRTGAKVTRKSVQHARTESFFCGGAACVHFFLHFVFHWSSTQLPDAIEHVLAHPLQDGLNIVAALVRVQPAACPPASAGACRYWTPTARSSSSTTSRRRSCARPQPTASSSRTRAAAPATSSSATSSPWARSPTRRPTSRGSASAKSPGLRGSEPNKRRPQRVGSVSLLADRLTKVVMFRKK